MLNTLSDRRGRGLLVGLLALAALTLACSPAAPTPPPYTTPPAPTVTAVTPALGSADGGAPVKIDGTSFQRGAVVRFGGIAVNATLGNGSLYVATPPHAAGVVDVEVVIGGQTGTLLSAYTYTAPDTLDFNGTWSGWIGESDFQFRFTVEANVVTAVSCGGVNLEITTPSPISNGQFSYVGPGGSIVGRIVSPLQSRGTVTMPSCVDPFTNQWFAEK